jgi:hypothetical protein
MLPGLVNAQRDHIQDNIGLVPATVTGYISAVDGQIENDGGERIELCQSHHNFYVS